MRSAADVERFRLGLEQDLPEDQADRLAYYTACYEACIPRLFWEVSSEKVTHNHAVFRKVVLNYCKKRKRVLKHGYSLLFMGDNGAGKTMFLSFVLSQMIKRGCSAYYTTFAQFDIDIKKGFGDKDAERRLEELMDSDFVAIDEIGKEHYKSDSYLNTRFEHLMKTRYDDGSPMIMATNLDYEKLSNVYGPSIASMWEGRYLKATFESGDFRKTAQARMKKALGV